MMFIELHVCGQCLMRWTPDDFGLYCPAEVSPLFESAAKEREEFSRLFIDVFNLRMDKIIRHITKYDLYLVFESNIHNVILIDDGKEDTQ